MSVSRLEFITKIGVEQMGDLADSLADDDVLRLENLDTDVRIVYSNEPVPRLRGVGNRFKEALT
jgi:hypothetical protein